ncbi:nicotinamide/nicotinic acid mononucleotide adenylyltransferase 1-like [Diadema antillarum]|uniref:nicotinamide/nicotinic acid mononucleotide adenylyltransferase 1-like n=1 Tax=Diadema antillarum TaxID=105358 RepID=UPI003A84F34C
MPGKFKFITICMKPNRDSTRRSRSASPHFFRAPPSPIKTSSTPTTCPRCSYNGAAAAASAAVGGNAYGEIPTAPASTPLTIVRQPHIATTDKMAAPTRVMLLACGSFNPITNMHLRMFEIARDYLNHKGGFQVIGGILSPVNDGYKKKGLISGKHRTEMCKLAIESSDWLKVDTWEVEQPEWIETVKVLTHHDDELNSNKVNNNPELPLPPTCMATRRAPKRRRNSRKNETAVSNDFLVALRNVSSLACFGAGMLPNNEAEVEDAYGAPLRPVNNHVQVKLLCGADLLESFAVPGLWKDEDLETIVGKHGLVVITRSGSDPYKFIYDSDLLYKYSNNIQIVTEWIYNEISSTKIRTALRRNESVKYLIPEPVVKYIQSNDLYNGVNFQMEKGN